MTDTQTPAPDTGGPVEQALARASRACRYFELRASATDASPAEEHGYVLATEVRRLHEETRCAECEHDAFLLVTEDLKRTEAALAACRAAAGEQDIRLAGVEAERDHYRAALAEMTTKRDALFEEATTARRELAALREQTCETCKHHDDMDRADFTMPYCRLWSSGGVTYKTIFCADIKTCGAWKGKTDA